MVLSKPKTPHTFSGEMFKCETTLVKFRWLSPREDTSSRQENSSDTCPHNIIFQYFRTRVFSFLHNCFRPTDLKITKLGHVPTIPI